MPLTIAKSYYTAFNRKDWEGMLGLTSDDILHFPNEGELRKGRAALREFIEGSAKAYDEQLTNFVYYPRSEGDGVAVEFVVNGTYIASQAGYPEARGQRYVVQAGAFISLRDGKITRLSTYYNLQDWVNQVSGRDPL